MLFRSPFRFVEQLIQETTGVPQITSRVIHTVTLPEQTLATLAKDDANIEAARRSLKAQLDASLWELLAPHPIESCAALLYEVRDTVCKVEHIHRWRRALMGRKGDDGTDAAPALGKLETLQAQVHVLESAIAQKGGWKAAVYLDSGDLNLEVHLAYWSPEEQKSMLLETKAVLLADLDRLKGARLAERRKNQVLVKDLTKQIRDLEAALALERAQERNAEIGRASCRERV